jgi:hypothetical protein
MVYWELSTPRNLLIRVPAEEKGRWSQQALSFEMIFGGSAFGVINPCSRMRATKVEFVRMPDAESASSF